jgi:hypothetical protein
MGGEPCPWMKPPPAASAQAFEAVGLGPRESAVPNDLSTGYLQEGGLVLPGPRHRQHPSEQMSFKQRQRRRKKSEAIAAAQKAARRSGSAARRYWLTLLQRKGCCARCGNVLREGAEAVYRHEPREALCLRCADRERIPYRPSVRWERDRRKRRSK